MSAALIHLKPRELADLVEMAHKRQYSLDILWLERAAYLEDAPEWAVQALATMRAHEHLPALTVDCPTCASKAGEWCVMGSRPRENFLHDQRRFKAWEQEQGVPFHPQKS